MKQLILIIVLISLINIQSTPTTSKQESWVYCTAEDGEVVYLSSIVQLSNPRAYDIENINILLAWRIRVNEQYGKNLLRHDKVSRWFNDKLEASNQRNQDISFNEIHLKTIKKVPFDYPDTK